jgi:PAS domain S-box-containing protein
MKSVIRARLAAYAIAVGVTLLALMLSIQFQTVIGHTVFILFFATVIFNAWYGGLGPGLLTAVLSAVAVQYFLMPHHPSWAINSWDDALPLGLFMLISGLISSLQAMRQQAEEWFRVILTSIGDAVIATDLDGRVVLMNAEAERLTGWPGDQALKHDLAEVFDILNEHTRQAVEHPVTTVLREGSTVGLANHTLLRAKDGTERPIDDSAAPIRDGYGRLRGAVLVFRDITERKRAEEERAQLLAR